MTEPRQCAYCAEPIAADEPFEHSNGGAAWLHRECMIRMVIGSVGHQQGTCPCFGGNLCDPPGASRRQAARAAARVFWAHSAGKA